MGAERVAGLGLLAQHGVVLLAPGFASFLLIACTSGIGEDFAFSGRSVGSRAVSAASGITRRFSARSVSFACLCARLLWAELLRRVFGTDPLECCRCGQRMRLVALIDDPAVVRHILDHLGLPTTLPKLTPARAPPQQDFDFGA